MTHSRKHAKILAIATTFCIAIGLSHAAKADWHGLDGRNGGDNGVWQDHDDYHPHWHHDWYQDWHHDWHHGDGAPPPVYYAPPRAYYVPPPPVYYAPPPLYYTQPGY